MKFSSLKELLLRKTEDESLRTAIKNITENALTHKVIESLRKDHSPLKGADPNEAVSHFNDNMNPDVHPAMIREALGHHASRYKAALNAGNEKLANDHASRFFKILDFAHTAATTSNGKLDVHSIALQPWELTHHNIAESYADRIARDPNYKAKPVYESTSKSLEQRVRDTKNTAYKPKKNDWSFLRNAPHVEVRRFHDEVAAHGHTGAYPMEQVAINGLHIPIEDVENLYDGNKLHPFDYHPILEHYNVPHPKSKDPAENARRIRLMDEYKNLKHSAYESGPHPEKFAEQIAKLHESGALEGRGSQPGSPVHYSQSQAEIDPGRFANKKSTSRRGAGKGSAAMRDVQKILQSGSTAPASQPPAPEQPSAPAKTEEYTRSPEMQALWNLLPGKKP